MPKPNVMMSALIPMLKPLLDSGVGDLDRKLDKIVDTLDQMLVATQHQNRILLALAAHAERTTV